MERNAAGDPARPDAPSGSPQGGAGGPAATGAAGQGGEPTAGSRAGTTAPGDPAAGSRAGAERGARWDDRWLDALMNIAFLTLLGGALLRYVLNHSDSPRLPWVIGLSAALAVLQLAGPRLTPLLGRVPPRRAELLRFGLTVGCWVVVVLLAPSFAWCAVPLIYTALRSLPERAALALVAVLSALVVYAEWQLRTGLDPNLFLLPPTVAALATGVFLHMRRQADRLRALVDDLIRTRRELAATERREGTLAERQRLSMEIHDTLAQGLSSQQMLLQAAERTWDSDPGTARGHVRTAESIAERSLAEARRFVHDLAPADLAAGGGLAQALRALAGRESDGALRVRVLVDGAPDAPLPVRVQSALLRIAQGALANVREHAAASLATITLTHLGDQVLLDVADDGRGFPAGELPAAGVAAGDLPAAAGPAEPVRGGGSSGTAPGMRGHGIAAMRARVGGLGGVLTVESTPGEGTVVSAAIPLDRPVGPPVNRSEDDGGEHSGEHCGDQNEDRGGARPPAGPADHSPDPSLERK